MGPRSYHRLIDKNSSPGDLEPIGKETITVIQVPHGSEPEWYQDLVLAPLSALRQAWDRAWVPFDTEWGRARGAGQHQRIPSGRVCFPPWGLGGAFPVPKGFLTCGGNVARPPMCSHGWEQGTSESQVPGKRYELSFNADIGVQDSLLIRRTFSAVFPAWSNIY